MLVVPRRLENDYCSPGLPPRVSIISWLVVNTVLKSNILTLTGPSTHHNAIAIILET